MADQKHPIRDYHDLTYAISQARDRCGIPNPVQGRRGERLAIHMVAAHEAIPLTHAVMRWANFGPVIQQRWLAAANVALDIQSPTPAADPTPPYHFLGAEAEIEHA